MGEDTLHSDNPTADTYFAVAVACFSAMGTYGQRDLASKLLETLKQSKGHRDDVVNLFAVATVTYSLFGRIPHGVSGAEITGSNSGSSTTEVHGDVSTDYLARALAVPISNIEAGKVALQEQHNFIRITSSDFDFVGLVSDLFPGIDAEKLKVELSYLESHSNELKQRKKLHLSRTESDELDDDIRCYGEACILQSAAMLLEPWFQNLNVEKLSSLMNTILGYGPKPTLPIPEEVATIIRKIMEHHLILLEKVHLELDRNPREGCSYKLPDRELFIPVPS